MITVYDAWHKENPLSPVVMGLCRVLVYLTAALAVAGAIDPAVWGGAVVLLCYLIGLTYVAKQENLTEVRHLWPLAFLGAPFLYAWRSLLDAGAGAILYLAFLGWVVFALSLLVRPRRRRHPARRREPDRRHLAPRRAPDRGRRRAGPGPVGRRRLRAHARLSALGAGDLAGSRWRAAAAGRILEQTADTEGA